MNKAMWRWVSVALMLQLFLIVIRAREFFLYADDYLNFAVFKDMGFTGAYLVRDLFGQIVPGYRIVQAIAWKTIGLNYNGLQAVLGVVALSTTILFAGVLRRLGGQIWAVGIATILFATLPQMGQVQQWWSSGIHTVFSLFGIMAAAYCVAGAGRRRVIASAAWIAFAVLFTAKVLFALAIIAGVAWVSAERMGLHSRDRWRSAIAITAACCVPALAYLGLFAVFSSHQDIPRATPAEMVPYTWLLIADTTIASTFGLGASGAGGPLWLLVAAVVVLAIVGSLRSSTVAVMWVAVIAYLVASSLLIAWERGGYFPSSSLWLRYGVEGGAFVLMGLALSASTLRAEKSLVIATTALCAMAVGSIIIHTDKIPFNGNRDANRSYTKHFRRSMAQLPADAKVLDGPVPEYIIPQFMGYYSSTGWLFRLYRRPELVARDAKPTYRVNEQGDIVPL